MKSTMREVMKIVAQELNVPGERISCCSRLAELGADSVDQLGLAMRLEETFDIEICDEELARMRTVGDIVELVERTRKESPG
jgi:acyl carrier protein